MLNNAIKWTLDQILESSLDTSESPYFSEDEPAQAIKKKKKIWSNFKCYKK